MYNLNTDKQVVISYQNAAKIFSGQIKRWNDPLLQADNNRVVNVAVYKKDANGEIAKDSKGAPIVLRTNKKTIKVTLPNQPITVIYRADSSGTTGNLTAAFNAFDKTTWTKSSKVFTDLVKVSADPIHFQGANGSAGVAQLANKTKYSITYAEVNFAETNKSLALASVINANGDLVQPTADAAGGFVATAPIGANGVVALDYLNKGAGVYPFTVVTYALALTNYGDAAKAASVKKAIEFAAFSCTKTAPNDGFIQIAPTSPLGVKITAQLAKLGK
jgi:phosphate transport system substrate-binding protein